MSIPFTQYLRPDGRERPITIDRSSEIEALALKLYERGCRFEVEVLTTGEISLECVKPPSLTTVPRDPDDEEFRVVANEICQNGPEVEAAVDRLVRGAHARFHTNSEEVTT